MREFWKEYPDSEQYLKTWYDIAMDSDWKTRNDAKQSYANASILKDSRIVFNIKGNSYRLVVNSTFLIKWHLSDLQELIRTIIKLMRIAFKFVDYGIKTD